MPSARAHNFLPWTIQNTQDNVIDIAGGEGIVFWNSKGERYLDFVSQIFNVNLGHGNRRIIDAIKEQADRFSVANPSFMHEGRALLGERLKDVTPGNLSKTFFTNSGSEANEIAFEIARLYTGRQKIFAKYRSYHGTTVGTLTTGGDPRRTLLDQGQPGSVRFFGPYCYRCDFKLEFPSCEIHCASALEEQIIMEGPETVAAIVLEPFTAAAAGYPVPPGYLKMVREISDKYGIVMITDEVICGFGRTGEWFAVNHEPVVPDILTVAKGITSGYVPMGAAIVNEPISEHFEDKLLPIGCTYTGHPLACAAALACLDQYEEGAIEHGRKMGEILSRELNAMKERHPCIGDVRSQGLFACLELVKDRQTRERLVEFNTSPPLVNDFKAACFRRGLYVYMRWNLVLMAPPLIINEEELLDGLGRLDEVFADVNSEWKK